MKTLYVSDLDGTLLHSDEKTSEYTNNIINSLVDRGMIFSYATARSYQTSHKVTKGLNANIPLIIYNGAMIVDNKNGDFILNNFFEADVQNVIADLFAHDVYPTVYAFVEGEEKFSYIPEKCTEGMKEFLETRKNDKRDHPVENKTDLCQGEIFYLTCIDEKEKLEELYHKYKDTYHCVFQTGKIHLRRHLLLSAGHSRPCGLFCRNGKDSGCTGLCNTGYQRNRRHTEPHRNFVAAAGKL